MQTYFRISHGSRTITILATKITLTIYQQVTHAPILGHTHHGIINRFVAVWVIFTKHLSYDTSGFLMRPVKIVTQFVHRKQNTAVNGLKTVSYIGQCATYYYRHRIIDIGGLHLLVNIYGNYAVLIVGFLRCNILFHT